MIEPGAIIGIVGGGQLGRMLSIAAAQLGYKCHIFDPHEHPVAADVAAHFTRAAFDDVEALQRFGEHCAVVTYEFENLPVASLSVLGAKLRPGTRSLKVAQDRAEEKAFIEASGAQVAPWRSVVSLADVQAAVEALGCPLVLKTRRYGYDGKGQAWVRSPEEAASAWKAIGAQPAVAEAGIRFVAEFSIILVRGSDGTAIRFDAPENEHEGGILRRSTVPASAAVQAQAEAAAAMAVGIAEALDHVGVLTVEFFASADGPIVNEIAPRVHNSGHWSIEGAATSQFEQHIRACVGLPLGSTRLRAPQVTMQNLIGDDVLAWRELVSEKGAAVHLYGKGTPRPGRKMGHVTRLHD
ncbi:5-(carboxyamino)imidazole ribonucleotide synthase [Sphingomonas arenae]|uniref:5-(carboxyamino)imidazole ribonucleotide synthase n=1 Tax=Sphingomonas arenae TaxID=2812555 RepID=UPI0019682068